jgi:hypothetical protein
MIVSGFLTVPVYGMVVGAGAAEVPVATAPGAVVGAEVAAPGAAVVAAADGAEVAGAVVAWGAVAR